MGKSKLIADTYIILSRNQELYATKRLVHEFKRRKLKVLIIDPFELICVAEKHNIKVLYKGAQLSRDVFVIPRTSQVAYEYTVLVARSLERSGIKVLNSSDAIIKAKDKYTCLLELSSKGINVVPSVLIRSVEAIKYLKEILGKPPLVVKAIRSMAGLGTTLVENEMSLNSSLQMMWYSWYDTIAQKYIKNNPSVDYRVVIIGNKVACVTRRVGTADFRTNYHQGGHFEPAKLPKSVVSMCVKSAKIVGLTLSAVDLIEDKGQFYVLEINSSPGFEGIEKALSMNLVKHVIDYCVKEKKYERK